MKHASKFVIATALFSLSLISVTAFGQSVVRVPKQNGAGGEVEQLVAELHKKNETVVSTCLENCDSQKRDNLTITGGEFDVKVLPEYPTIARAAHASGSVVVLMIVDEEGKVVAAQSISGHPLLQAAAVRAARSSTFHPYLLNGQAVKVRGTLTYNFVID